MIRLYDYISCAVPELVAVRDPEGRVSDLNSDSILTDAATKEALIAKVDATRSGVLTNRRVYPGIHVRGGVPTWTDQYEKPVLERHPVQSLFGPPDEPTVLGRVKAAKFHALVPDEKLKQDYLNPHPNGQPGTGYIRLAMQISGEAIERVQDGRYLTVSTGQDTKSFTCNICNQDWMQSGRCDHDPGRYYRVDEDGKEIRDEEDAKKKKTYDKLCYIITGPLLYDHVAFVNRPAQPLATVFETTLEKLKDSLDSCDWGDTEFTPGNVGFAIRRENGLHLLIDADQFDSIPDSEKKTSSTSVSVPKPLPVTKQMCDQELAEALIIASVFDSGATFEFDDELTESMAWKAWDRLESVPLTDEQIQSLGLQESDLEDRTLSAAARKRLKGGTFCGPDRSFPVPDCKHVTAARRLVGRYKGPGSKQRILACVNRKAKSLGCDSDTKDDATMPEDVQDAPEATPAAAEPETTTDSAPENQEPNPGADDSQGTDEPEVPESTSEPETTTDADADANDGKAKSTVVVDELAKMNEDQLRARVLTLDSTLRARDEEVSRLIEENKKLIEQNRDMCIDQIIDYKRRSGTVIEDADETALREKYTGRDLVSLNDMRSDLREEAGIARSRNVEHTKVTDPTKSHPAGDSATAPNSGKQPEKPARTAAERIARRFAPHV